MSETENRDPVRRRAERMKQLVTDPDFVSGIYNYCDQWCERCPMTSRCSVYAMSNDPRPSGQGETAEDLGSLLTETFEATTSLLEELAEEAGIDLDATIAEFSAPPDESGVDGHILIRDAENYEASTREWFGRWEPYGAEDMGRTDDMPPYLQVVGRTPKASAVADLVDTVMWYHTLIPAKIARALGSGHYEPPDDMPEFPSDADGSAKVALIAIDRSKAAWGRLLEHYPSAKSDIAVFLHRLERLRCGTEWAFPKARDFIRPGFDDAASPP
jgi:hypothetical protein